MAASSWVRSIRPPRGSLVPATDWRFDSEAQRALGGRHRTERLYRASGAATGSAQCALDQFGADTFELRAAPDRFAATSWRI